MTSQMLIMDNQTRTTMNSGILKICTLHQTRLCIWILTISYLMMEAKELTIAQVKLSLGPRHMITHSYMKNICEVKFNLLATLRHHHQVSVALPTLLLTRPRNWNWQQLFERILPSDCY